MIYENITKNCLQNYKGTIGEEIIIEGKNNYYFKAINKICLVELKMILKNYQKLI